MRRLYQKVTTIMMLFAAAAVLTACVAATTGTAMMGDDRSVADVRAKAFPKFGGH